MPVGISLYTCPSAYSMICLFSMGSNFEGLKSLVIGLVPIRATGICILGLTPSHALKILRNDKVILG